MTTNFVSKLLFICLVFLPCITFSNSLEQQRNDFLQAEQALNQGDDAVFFELSVTLVDYSLYPYLQYQWLSQHLSETNKISAFLTTYSESRYALLLRNKWLSYLAEQQRWQEFMHYYQTTDNTALICQFHWANYQLGNTAVALTEAKRLWSTGDELPNECDALLAGLLASADMTSELIWQRFQLALKKDHVKLANHIQRLMSKNYQEIAAIWLQVHKNPSLLQKNQFQQAALKDLFVHGIVRMSKHNLEQALVLWDNHKETLNLNQELSQEVERTLGLALARKRDARAYDQLSLVLNPDGDVREWKIRAALLAQNWQQVRDALANLTAEERQEPKWQYWQARALAQTGDIPAALALLNQLSVDRSFYGFLAADVVNKPYQFADKPVLLASGDLDTLANETDFKVAKELSFFNRDLEVKRQWSFATKKLSKPRLLIAAKLAQSWQWDQLAIITLVQANYWDDLSVRFPTTYATQVVSNAMMQQLEPALIFGLMRQESMLDKNAQSAAGARGLMQIMPATGKQIAHKLNESWWSANVLFEPNTNIKYGTFYYKQLLDQFNGHFALAAAAYNAGPHRVKQWLPEQAMPTDVWIETIPFNETRKYVSSVLYYTLMYTQRLQQSNMKLKNFLPDLVSS